LTKIKMDPQILYFIIFHLIRSKEDACNKSGPYVKFMSEKINKGKRSRRRSEEEEREGGERSRREEEEREGGERRRREKNNNKFSGHYVCLALRSDQLAKLNGCDIEVKCCLSLCWFTMSHRICFVPGSPILVCIVC
jgi:hypothetical protein